MARQTLKCKAGQHVWTREGQRGKPPENCKAHAPDKKARQTKATVINAEVSEPEVSADSISMSGEAVCDRLMMMLASRGTLLSQQKSHVYAGPRY